MLESSVELEGKDSALSKKELTLELSKRRRGRKEELEILLERFLA